MLKKVFFAVGFRPKTFSQVSFLVTSDIEAAPEILAVGLAEGVEQVQVDKNNIEDIKPRKRDPAAARTCPSARLRQSALT